MTPTNNQPLLTDLELIPISARGISQKTCEKFGYGVSTVEGESVQVAPYRDKSGRIVGQKVRPRDKKKTRFRGQNPGTLFGQHLWRPNSKLRLTITEGELDCLAVYETQGDYPCVSVPSGAQSARRAIAENIEFCSGFKEVVIVMDEDEPGRKAAEEIAAILPPGLAFVAQLPLNDPCEMLAANRKAELRECLWRATPFRPDGICLAAELWDDVQAEVEPSFALYPWPVFNDFLGGLRRREIVTFCAQSGVGKSTVIREVTHSLIRSGHRVGILALEESTKQTVLFQIGLALNSHVHLGHAHIPDADFRAAFDEVSKNLVLWDHFGSAETSRIESIIRHMVLSEGCSVICLDHVSMVVSGRDAATTNERRDLDVLMTTLRALAEQLDVCLLAVSHIKRIPDDRDGQIKLTDLRGSASIEQLSDACVSLERAKDNTTRVRVLKNRAMGWRMGVAGKLQYDADTGRLVEVPDPDNDVVEQDFAPEEPDF